MVAPAATQTPMLADPARAGVQPRLPPMGRFIQPAEVAATTAFLLSAGAASITGQQTVVCGGASFRAPELDVADYRIEARSYGKASVRCSHSLSTRTDSGGQIDFAGECEVRSYDPNVRRR